MTTKVEKIERSTQSAMSQVSQLSVHIDSPIEKREKDRERKQNNVHRRCRLCKSKRFLQVKFAATGGLRENAEFFMEIMSWKLSGRIFINPI